MPSTSASTAPPPKKKQRIEEPQIELPEYEPVAEPEYEIGGVVIAVICGATQEHDKPGDEDESSEEAEIRQTDCVRNSKRIMTIMERTFDWQEDQYFYKGRLDVSNCWKSPVKMELFIAESQISEKAQYKI